MANIMHGKIVAGGVEFSWLHTWWAASTPDYPELGGTLTWGTPPQQRWTPKHTREGAVVRTRDILFLLWDIYRENERSIPDAVWDARHELEREIMALPESAL